MFSTTKTFEIKIISGGDKRCSLRWPTDAEWAARAKRTRTVRRLVGRNQAVTEVADAPKANLELFEAIRIDKDGAAFDEVEASRAIEKLERVEVVSVDREGDSYVVRLAVPGGEVVHRLRIPLQADVVEYSRGAVQRREGRREVSTVVNLEPAAKLWDKITLGVEGYAEGSAVPIVHKDVAVVEVLGAMQAEEEEDPEA